MNNHTRAYAPCPAWCTGEHTDDAVALRRGDYDRFHQRRYCDAAGELAFTVTQFFHNDVADVAAMSPEFESVTPESLAEVDELTALFRQALLDALDVDLTRSRVPGEGLKGTDLERHCHDKI